MFCSQLHCQHLGQHLEPHKCLIHKLKYREKEKNIYSSSTSILFIQKSVVINPRSKYVQPINPLYQIQKIINSPLLGFGWYIPIPVDSKENKDFEIESLFYYTTLPMPTSYSSRSRDFPPTGMIPHEELPIWKPPPLGPSFSTSLPSKNLSLFKSLLNLLVFSF